MRPFAALLTTAALLSSTASALPSPYETIVREDGGLVARKIKDGHGYGKTKSGAVATEAGPCSEIGIEILKEGGNAADAVSSFCYWILCARVGSCVTRPNGRRRGARR